MRKLLINDIDLDWKNLISLIHYYTVELGNWARIFNKKKYNQSEIINEYRWLMLLPIVLDKINTHKPTEIIEFAKQQFDKHNKYENMVLQYINNVNPDTIIWNCLIEVNWDKCVRKKINNTRQMYRDNIWIICKYE